jgi:hypothetical protein
MGMRMLVGVRVRMSMRVAVLFTVVMAWPVFVLMIMSVFMVMALAVFMVVVLPVSVLVRMRVCVFVVMSSDPHGIFPRQSAAAIFTHYSISNDASSISLPARKSPLGWWQSGQSANMSSD